MRDQLLELIGYASPGCGSLMHHGFVTAVFSRTLSQLRIAQHPFHCRCKLLRIAEGHE